MKHGSLFSGIGGFDLAAEWMGWTNEFHCEINPFCNTILNHYWPNAKSYTDIKTTDFNVWRGHIDILTGGFPCQPYSMAGKRKGKEDERHLWPQYLRAIQEIRPRWVIGENVAGLVNWGGGLVFREVCADLENEGYEVQTYLIPACSKNAPHKRERLWVIAYSNSSNDRGKPRGNERTGNKERVQERNEIREFGEPSEICGLTANCKNVGQPHATKINEWGKCELHDREILRGTSNPISAGGITANPESQQGERLQPCECARNSEPEQEQFGGSNSAGIFTNPTSILANWKNWPTQSPICNGDDGISTQLDTITFPKWRNESIKGGGNAIVPQVAYEIFKAIEIIEDETNNQI